MKKVIVIILVALMLFAFVVPCFADFPPDYQFYFTNSYNSLYVKKWDNRGTVNVVVEENQIIVTSTAVSDLWYAGVRIGNVFTIGRYYFILSSVTIDGYSYVLEYWPGSTSKHFTSGISYFVGYCNPSSMSEAQNRILIYPYTSAFPSDTSYYINNIVVCDITDIYDPSHDADYYYNLLSNYIDFSHTNFPSTGYYYLSDTFQPLGDFYANIWHSFDWLGDLFTKHSALLVAVTISLSLSGIALCVILAIKRFKE